MNKTSRVDLVIVTEDKQNSRVTLGFLTGWTLVAVIKEKKRMRRMNDLEASDLRLVEVDVIQQILASCFSVSMRK